MDRRRRVERSGGLKVDWHEPRLSMHSPWKKSQVFAISMRTKMDGHSKTPDAGERDMQRAASTPATSPSARATKPEEVFYIAVCYRWSAKILWEQGGNLHPPAVCVGLLAQLSPIGFSAFILECLSIEIFLKCLVQLESSSSTTRPGHSLAQLFAQLSPQTQSRIKQIYDSLGKPTDDPAMWNFDSVLRTLDRAFVTWRYPYEYGMGPTVFCTTLAFALQQVILELRPEWEPYTLFRKSSAPPAA